MSALAIDPALQLVWAVANAEACGVGAARIEPVHFLLAVLKVLDDGFRRDAEALGLPRAAIDELPQIAAEGRRLLGLSDDQLTAARRALRRAIDAGTTSGPTVMLHRAVRSRALFDGAAARAVRAGAPTHAPPARAAGKSAGAGTRRAARHRTAATTDSRGRRRVAAGP